MIFGVEISVPANTAKASPLVTTLKLTACIIRRFTIEFPLGCYWLAGARVMLREHQLYPTNPDAWLVGHGRVIETADNQALVDSPNELDIECYNLDQRYAHTLRAYVDVDVVDPTQGGGYVPDAFLPFV